MKNTAIDLENISIFGGLYNDNDNNTESTYIDFLDTDIKHSLGSRISYDQKNRIIKFIDRCEEMPVAYRIANLVCSCSIEPEAFGRVSVEAQAMELPVVASNIGGSTETIVKDKTGFLFKSGDPKDLADTIKIVMKKDYNSLKSIGFEGRKNILKKFDVDKMCYTTFTEYKKLIE